MMLTKLFDTFINTQRTQFHKHCGLGTLVFKINSMCTNAFDKINLLSSEEKEKILNIINSKNTEDLLQFSKSIISGKKMSSKKMSYGLVLTPKAVGDIHKKVNTVLGIHIGPNMISWSLLNRDSEVLQWSYKSFPEKRAKENLHTLVQVILPIVAKLPKAERYVMQETGGDMCYQQSRKFYLAYVRQSIIGAIIMSYLTLNCKLDDTAEFVANNIFILRQHTLRKIYGLIIDNEVISTQYMLQKLLQENDKLLETKERWPSVSINAELRNMYQAQSSVYQEQMNWSLLIALAFLELVVHERTDMIVRSAQ
ncbi:transcription elongation factor, mitochondrial isoform X2 [Linepithema humile]|uniref:transcription elongation factor, mitochondrial isoform X2 n=1 Tax=Linepithema humile TaxID=83485 RepID=UPI00351DAB44